VRLRRIEIRRLRQWRLVGEAERARSVEALEASPVTSPVVAYRGPLWREGSNR
jgi:hypothetical protein